MIGNKNTTLDNKNTTTYIKNTPLALQMEG